MRRAHTLHQGHGRDVGRESAHELAEAGIIYQRRGMGYYTADDARDTIIKKRRETFVRNTIPELRRTMDELGYTPQDILNLLND